MAFDHKVTVRFFRPKIVAREGRIILADQHTIFGAPECGGVRRLEVSEISPVEEGRKLNLRRKTAQSRGQR